MAKTKVWFVALIVGLFATFGAHAESFGTKDEAIALVNKAAAFVKSEGKDKALAEFSNPAGKFVDRDLYIIAYAMDGTRLAHPHNPKLIGKSAADAKDFDGKPYGKEMVDLANGAGNGWVDYKFTDPVTKKLSDKSTYLLKVGDVFLACGIYKH